MIAFPFSEPDCQRALRPLLEQSAIPAVLVPTLVSVATARRLRSQARQGLVAFDRPTRGRYQVNTRTRCKPLEDALGALASEITGLILRPARPAWLRFRSGDYATREDDAVRRAGLEDCVEVTLDLSTRATVDARVVYTAGALAFVAPQVPLMAAVVRRTPALSRYECYLPHKVRGAEVWRLRLCFPIVEQR